MAKKRDIKASTKAAAIDAKNSTTKKNTKDAPVKKPPASPLKVVSTSATGGVFVDHLVPKAEQYKVV